MQRLQLRQQSGGFESGMVDGICFRHGALCLDVGIYYYIYTKAAGNASTFLISSVCWEIRRREAARPKVSGQSKPPRLPTPPGGHGNGTLPEKEHLWRRGLSSGLQAIHGCPVVDGIDLDAQIGPPQPVGCEQRRAGPAERIQHQVT